MYDYGHWRAYVREGRNGVNRPAPHGGHNTRIHTETTGAVSVKLHNTDVVVFREDGRIEVCHNGHTSRTTRERIREYTNAKVSGGVSGWGGGNDDWFLATRDPRDPEPPNPRRTIARPFHAPDPGPEPVDSGKGCDAGARVTVGVYKSEILRPHDLRDSDRNLTLGPGRAMPTEPLYTRTRSVLDWIAQAEDSYFVWAHRWSVTVTDIGEKSWRPYEPNERTQYAQCEHCKAFQAKLADWRIADATYRRMCENLERYGSREAWQEAYIEDFRAVRAARALHRQWTRRNLVPFDYGLHEIDEDGYAPLKAKRAWMRQLKSIEKRERAEKRANEIYARRRRREESKRRERIKRRRALLTQGALGPAFLLTHALEIATNELEAVKKT